LAGQFRRRLLGAARDRSRRRRQPDARFSLSGGAFHDTFVYDSVTDAWTMRLDAADGSGGWKRFAEYRAVRR